MIHMNIHMQHAFTYTYHLHTQTHLMFISTALHIVMNYKSNEPPSSALSGGMVDLAVATVSGTAIHRRTECLRFNKVSVIMSAVMMVTVVA